MAVQKRTAMCKMNNSKKALLRALRGIRSFAHAILFICKQYLKTPDIPIPYICQETNGNFLFFKGSSLSQLRIQNFLTDTQMVRCYFQKFIGIDEVQGFFQA